MRTGCKRAAAVAFIFALGGPAAAQSLDWEYEAGAVSDYRYRGESLSQGRAAVQAGVSASAESGLYARAWSSSLGGDGPTGPVEVDLSAGRTLKVRGFDVDLGVTGYFYPQGSANYLEFPGEISRELGDWTVSAGGAFAPAQHGTGGRSGAYLFGAAEWAWPGRPVAARASVGHERAAWCGTKVDWSAGVSWRIRDLELSFDYVGADGGETRSGLVVGIRVRGGEG